MVKSISFMLLLLLPTTATQIFKVAPLCENKFPSPVFIENKFPEVKVTSCDLTFGVNVYLLICIQ